MQEQARDEGTSGAGVDTLAYVYALSNTQHNRRVPGAHPAWHPGSLPVPRHHWQRASRSGVRNAVPGLQGACSGACGVRVRVCVCAQKLQQNVNVCHLMLRVVGVAAQCQRLTGCLLLCRWATRSVRLSPCAECLVAAGV
jgi:hypothetical protein